MCNSSGVTVYIQLTDCLRNGMWQRLHSDSRDIRQSKLVVNTWRRRRMYARHGRARHGTAGQGRPGKSQCHGSAWHTYVGTLGVEKTRLRMFISFKIKLLTKDQWFTFQDQLTSALRQSDCSQSASHCRPQPTDVNWRGRRHLAQRGAALTPDCRTQNLVFISSCLKAVTPLKLTLVRFIIWNPVIN